MIYLDACIAIYLVEEHSVFGPQLEAALNEREIYCISPLVEMECLVLPIKQQRQELMSKFRHFFATQHRLAMPSTVFHLAAELRAQYGIKTPDALHLATALHHDCTALWTNDDRLCKVAGDLVVNMLGRSRLG
jgi:predicted nucleic acid-binding protein